MGRREQNAYLMNFRLAFRAESVVNWDPVDKVVVADEEVENGRAWRSGALVEKKVIRQWFFRITAYAERLAQRPGHGGLAGADRQDAAQLDRQERRAPRSIFAHRRWPDDNRIRVFTTRPDTLWGATFMVLAPEHPLVTQITTRGQRAAVEAYVAQARGEDRDRAHRRRARRRPASSPAPTPSTR